MSTRKLILWALICGVFILGAGSIKLLQTTSGDAEVVLLQLGDEATLGDMTVRVLAVREIADRTLVDVQMKGVEGADATEGWRMLVGEVVVPVSLPEGQGTPCVATSAATELSCTVAFPVSDGTRTIVYIRAGEQQQWATAP
jgi:hypothetical protein